MHPYTQLHPLAQANRRMHDISLSLGKMHDGAEQPSNFVHLMLVAHFVVSAHFKETIKTMIFGIATRIDILNFIAKMEASEAET